MATGLLLCLPEYSNAVVIRTRDEEVIKRATVVIDVGGVYGEVVEYYCTVAIL